MMSMQSSSRFLFALSCLFCAAVHANGAVVTPAKLLAKATGGDSAFMLVAGITAPAEMCLTASGDSVGLESCLDAVASGTGRDLWSFESGGQLLHKRTQKCAGAAAGGETIALVPCANAGAWELLANGQVKIGKQCLSQRGLSAGLEDVAAMAAASASSTADASAHGAWAAVDGNGATYWASHGANGPVSMTVDLGDVYMLDAVNIAWEYPAKSFSVAISVDGQQWTDVFATSVNVLSGTSISLGGKQASKVKVVMQEARGEVFGIRSIGVLAPSMRSVLEDCATAAKSTDARDKYFTAYVSEFDSSASQAFMGEVAPLAEAVASLSRVTSDVAEVVPKLSLCSKGAALARAPRNLRSQGGL